MTPGLPPPLAQVNKSGEFFKQDQELHYKVKERNPSYSIPEAYRKPGYPHVHLPRHNPTGAGNRPQHSILKHIPPQIVNTPAKETYVPGGGILVADAQEVIPDRYINQVLDAEFDEHHTHFVNPQAGFRRYHYPLDFDSVLSRGLEQDRLSRRSRHSRKFMARMHHRRRFRHHRRRHHRRHHHGDHLKKRERHVWKKWKHGAHSLRNFTPRYLRTLSTVVKDVWLVNGGTSSTVGSYIIGFSSGLAIFQPHLSFFMDPNDLTILQARYKYYKPLALLMELRVVMTQNMTRVSDAPASSTNVEYTKDSVYEPVIWVTTDTGGFSGGQPFSLYNTTCSEVPRAKRLDIGGGPVRFKWTCPHAERYEKWPTSGLVGGGSSYAAQTVLSTICQAVTSNQQLYSLCFAWPDYAQYTSGATVALGATARVEFRGAMIYDCTDNIGFADQSVV